ncbi:MAG: NUMOD4 motif-containing HNH endonuclease [Selenomonadaceae bacterium]|nr:NUMOD4 motif-containing HNH endonuclease [Selenomonadaceae bacterium]
MITETTRRRQKEAKKAYAALMAFYPLTLDDLDGEKWAWIPDYEGHYQESTYGRTKSFKKGKVRIMKPFLQGDYLYVDLCKDGVQKTFQINRIVAENFISNPENKPEVNHIDGNKLNNFVGNLEWVTHSENIQHAFATGLEEAKRGEHNWQASMTNETAKYIRDNPEGLTGVELAKKFGVSPKIISNIQQGKTYQEAGGKIREKISLRTPDHIREEIRRLYKKGVQGCGMRTLAKKFGLTTSTVLSIIREEIHHLV